MEIIVILIGLLIMTTRTYGRYIDMVIKAAKDASLEYISLDDNNK